MDKVTKQFIIDMGLMAEAIDRMHKAIGEYRYLIYSPYQISVARADNDVSMFLTIDKETTKICCGEFSIEYTASNWVFMVNYIYALLNVEVA